MNEITVGDVVYESTDVCEHYISGEEQERRIELVTQEEQEPFRVYVSYDGEGERSWSFETMQDAIQMVVSLEMDDYDNLGAEKVEPPFRAET